MGIRLLVILLVLLLILLLILLLVRLLVNLALQGRSGDSVQVSPGERKKNGTKRLSNQASSARYRFSLNSLSVDADLPSTVGGLLEHTDLLQRLEDGPLDTGSGVLVVRGPVSTTVGTTVELGEGTNTDVLPQVDVSGDRGCERASGIVSGLLLPGHS